MQQSSDIIARNHTHVDPPTETLVGLQADMGAEPLAGTPPHLPVDLGPDCRPRHFAAPEIEVADEADDASFTHHIDAYATAYQMRAPGTLQLEAGVRETMMREAILDDSFFRPNLRAMMLAGLQVGGQEIAVASVHNVHKRKRQNKEAD
jgi:hypothetical protein